jgi:hypothetical protein
VLHRRLPDFKIPGDLILRIFASYVVIHAENSGLGVSGQLGSAIKEAEEFSNTLVHIVFSDVRCHETAIEERLGEAREVTVYETEIGDLLVPDGCWGLGS